MFDQRQAVEDWRSELARRGLDQKVIDELVSHLEEAMTEMGEESRSDEEAFDAARERLGDPGDLAAEFRKVACLRPADRAFLWAGGILLVLLALVIAIWAARGGFGGNDPVLFTHVVTLTSGYFSLFLFALAGTYSVVRRWIGLSAEDAWLGSMKRILRWAALAGLLLVTTAIIAGGLWSLKSWGTAWRWNLPEVGSLVVWIWYVFAVSRLWFRALRPSQLPALALSGGIVVLFSWFGAAGSAGTGSFIATAVLLIVFFGAALRLDAKVREDSLAGC